MSLHSPFFSHLFLTKIWRYIKDKYISTFMKFYCVKCNFRTNDTSKYERHCNTKKHLNNQTNTYICTICSKSYKSRQGLYYHKKSCSAIEQKIDKLLENTKKNDEKFELLLKENKEIKTKLEQQKTTQINNNFNLNVYLNETCKDAMNLTDFIKQITIEYKDLDGVLDNGIESSIANVILEALKTVGSVNRPIQCSDLKRETVYVKDDNSWEKDQDRKLIENAIYKIRDKHVKTLYNLFPTDTSFINLYDEKYILLHQKLLSEFKTKRISNAILQETVIVK